MLDLANIYQNLSY